MKCYSETLPPLPCFSSSVNDENSITFLTPSPPIVPFSLFIQFFFWMFSLRYYIIISSKRGSHRVYYTNSNISVLITLSLSSLAAQLPSSVCLQNIHSLSTVQYWQTLLDCYKLKFIKYLESNCYVVLKSFALSSNTIISPCWLKRWTIVCIVKVPLYKLWDHLLWGPVVF